MNVVSVGTQESSISSPKGSQTTLSSEEFLKVLITQLKNQNPLEPMNDVEYITQVVQFSMLDGINALKQEFYENKAVGYIGKHVLGTISSDNNEQMLLEGAVQSISFLGNKVLLNLDNGSLYLDNLLEVSR